MTSKRALAHFRELSTLGMSGEAFGMAMLQGLHELVPSLHNRVVFYDPGRRAMTGFYCESAEMHARAPVFFERFDNRDSHMPGSGFAFAGQPGAGHFRPFVNRPEYFRSAYFNEIERPAGGHHFVDMLIGDGGGNLALVLLARERSAPAFSDREVGLLAQLVPQTARGLRRGQACLAAPDGGYAPSDTHELLVADFDGRLLHSSEHGLQRLALAWHPHEGLRSVAHQLRRTLPEPVVQLCQALRRTALDGTPPPAALRLESAWGRFGIQASLLRSEGDTEPSLQVALHLWHQRPQVLARMQSMRARGLSAGQIQVCMRLLDGTRSEADVASELGLAASTVHDHLRKAYRKLGVHSREQLVHAIDRGPG